MIGDSNWRRVAGELLAFLARKTLEGRRTRATGPVSMFQSGRTFGRPRQWRFAVIRVLRRVARGSVTYAPRAKKAQTPHQHSLEKPLSDRRFGDDALQHVGLRTCPRGAHLGRTMPAIDTACLKASGRPLPIHSYPAIDFQFFTRCSAVRQQSA